MLVPRAERIVCRTGMLPTGEACECPCGDEAGKAAATVNGAGAAAVTAGDAMATVEDAATAASRVGEGARCCCCTKDWRTGECGAEIVGAVMASTGTAEPGRLAGMRTLMAGRGSDACMHKDQGVRIDETMAKLVPSLVPALPPCSHLLPSCVCPVRHIDPELS
jgi:hypothetical protein